jgi:hypothetical protein
MPIPLGVLAVAGAGAAGGASSFDLLETVVTAGTTTADITFSSLNTYSDYKHLQIRYTVKFNSGTTGTTAMNVQLNADTAANYSRHFLQGTGASVNSVGSANTSNIQLFDAATRPSETDNYGAGVIDILDFSSSNKNTTIRALHGALTPSESYIYLSSGVWRNTAAVTSIKLFSVSGFNYSANCRFSLYGIK